MYVRGFYLARKSFLHTLNPLTKLFLSVALMVLSLSFTDSWLILALFLVILVPLAAWARVLLPFLRATTRTCLPLFFMVLVIQIIFHRGGEVLWFHWWIFSITAEALSLALLLSARILVMVSSFVFFVLITHPGEMMTDLVARGFSPTLTYVFLAALQLVPALQARARTILEAQEARGMEIGKGPLSQIRVYLPLVGPLIIGSLLEVEERAMALEARAFTSPTQKTTLHEIPDSRAQQVFRYLLVLTCLGTVGSRVVLSSWK